MTLPFDERDRASVIGDLSSPDEDVRRLAVERAEALPLDEALPLLVGRLGDTSWRVRKAAVERLVANPAAQQVATLLIGALADGENPGRRNGAVEALAQCGAPVVPELLMACQSPDPDVRKLVVDALAGIGDPSAGDSLLAMLDDRDPNVRAAAADGLGALGMASAGAALLERARHEDEDPLVRFSALRALGGLGLPVSARDLLPVLDDPILRAAALELLGAGDDPEALSVLLKALGAPSRSARESAMRGLLRLVSNASATRAEQLGREIREAVQASRELVEDAVEHLEEGDLPTRLVLVQFLGLARAEAAVVPVLRSARDEALAEVVLSILESFGSEVDAIIEVAWPDLDPAARCHACDLFGRTHGERGALLLANALESNDAELCVAAARGIARRGALAALPLLVRRLELVAPDDEIEAEEERAALSDAIVELARTGEAERSRVDALLQERLEGTEEGVRVALARILARIAPPEDAPIFLLLLKDPSAGVRRVAVEALGRLHASAASEPLRLALADEDASVRIRAATALGASEDESALQDLRSLADDPDPRVRATAVRGIGRRLLGDPPREVRELVHAALDAALRDDVLVALAAVEALGEVGGDLAAAASGVLERAEPELVREAVQCLGLHAPDEALAELIPLISHADWSVRAEAIRALAERRVMRAAPAILGLLDSERDEFVRGAILQALQRLEG